MLNAVLSIITILVMIPAFAAEPAVYRAVSPEHRVALLELYTSEGCSSCPPADRFMTALKQEGVSSDTVVPLAFHVTYWDYIGWKDRFGDEAYDRRQRSQASLSSRRRVYTPQFLMNGADYRRYSRFGSDVAEINEQKSAASIRIEARRTGARELGLDVAANAVGDQYSLWLAVFENNLESKVTDGENEGLYLRHDYVVRTLYGPYALSGKAVRVSESVNIGSGWKMRDLGVAAFLQKAAGSEVVQATSLLLAEDRATGRSFRTRVTRP